MVFFSNGAGADDAEQLANSSFFAWGYGGSQPPLYTWLTILTTKIFGTQLFSLQLLKFSLLASLFLSVYATMRTLGADRLVAFAAMLGLFLLPQIGWESQRALTHSILGTAGCGWTLLAFAYYIKKTTIIRALILGVAMSAALLGKFNTIIFIAALLAAGLSIRQLRHLLWHPHTLIAALTTFFLTAPAFIWMAFHSETLTTRINKLAIGVGETIFADKLAGLWNLATKSLNFTVLALAVSLICALLAKKNKSFEEIHENYPRDNLSHNVSEILLRRIVIFGWLFVAGLIIVSGSTQVKDRWLQPVLFVMPAILALILARYHINALIAFYRCCILTALIAPIALSLYISGTFSRHNPPINQLDYAYIYTHVIAQQPIAQILSPNSQISGNMRLFQPNLTSLHYETPQLHDQLEIPFVALWTDDPRMPQHLHDIITQANITLKPPIHHLYTRFINSKSAGMVIYYAYFPALY